MALHLIAGGSGSGKTTVGHELAAHGFDVIEADEDAALSGYVNRQTGERARYVPPYPLPSDWLKEHSWRWSRSRLRQIAEEHKGGNAFLCGGASGIQEFYPLFTRRFLIWVDARTTALRLQHREPERWRDGSAELTSVLKANEQLRRWAIREGFTLLIGSQSPEAIAGDIIAYLDVKSAGQP